VGVCAVLLLLGGALICCIRRGWAKQPNSVVFAAKSPVACSATSASDTGPSPMFTQHSGAELFTAHRTMSSNSMAVTPSAATRSQSHPFPVSHHEPPPCAAVLPGGSSLIPHASSSPQTQEASTSGSVGVQSLQARSKGLQSQSQNPEAVSFNSNSNERSFELTVAAISGTGQGGETGAKLKVPADSPYAAKGMPPKPLD
jgi:hypothetical protein